VQATDADNDSLTYLWEFPDGTRSDQRAFSRTFALGGTWRIRITVSDGKTSASSELSLTMKTMTGLWDFRGTSADPNANLGYVERLELTQSAGAISGIRHSVFSFGEYHCPLTGTVRATPPQVSIDVPECRTSTGGVYGAARWDFQSDADINTLVGTGQARNPMTGQVNPSFVTIRRQ
jgi:hypothetical protein